MNFPTSDLDKAYATAHFIHNDPIIAHSVVMDAIELFNSRARSPRFRRKAQSSRARRSKLKLSRSILFQLCVWQASNYFERRQEKEQFQLKGKAKIVRPMSEVFLKLFRPTEDYRKLWSNRLLNEMDLSIRYIKSLALFSLERGPEFVAVALGCLLYDYSREEAQTVYELTSHELRKPEVKHPLQNHRGRLMKLLEERFKGLCEVQTDGRGMKAFQTQPGSAELLAVVRESLDELNPWGTSCRRREDVWLQLHNFFHLPCHDQAFLHRGNQQLQMRRLALPVFLTHNAGSNARRHPPKLSPEEINDLIDASKSISGRRRKTPATTLLIAVDDEEVLEIDLSEQYSVRCELEPEARLIQVYARCDDNDLLLATCWLAEMDGEADETITVSHTAEGGQTVRFDIVFAEDGSTTVEISYRETKPWRWLMLEWQRWANRFALPKPATAWAIGGLALIGLLLFFWWRRPAPELPRVVKQPTPVAEPSTVLTPAGSPSPESPRLKRRAPLPGLARRSATPTPPETPVEGFDAERGSLRNIPRLPLHAVARVQVATLGEDTFSRQLRESLIARLRLSSFAVEEQISPTTDAVLQQKPESDKRFIRLRLVNRAGKVLWQERFLQQDAGQIAEQAIKALMNAVETEKKK